jgi:hypothetical protein
MIRKDVEKLEHNEEYDSLLEEINFSSNIVKESSLKEHRDQDCRIARFCELSNCLNCGRRLK